ncbi:hypothetical protein ARSEF1564_008455 [Beauveria bassiana]
MEDIVKILPKSPSTLGSWIKEKWVGDTGRRAWLKEKLQVATSKIHISMDAWTSEEGTNYLAIVAHFLDESHTLRTALLDLAPLKGPHSGENIARALSVVIDCYDISTVLGFFMMDNASNNDTCIQELAKKYPTIKPQSRHRCVGHMLNLIVKAHLFGKGVSKLEQQLRGASDEERFEIWRKQSFVGKLHNFCVWINRSDQRRELLKHQEKSDAEMSPYERIKLSMSVLDVPDDEDEFEKFINTPPRQVMAKTPLEWWCREEQRMEYSCLHQMAVDILSVPAMSDDPERMFSCTRRMVSWDRAKLGPETIENSQ